MLDKGCFLCYSAMFFCSACGRVKRAFIWHKGVQVGHSKDSAFAYVAKDLCRLPKAKMQQTMEFVGVVAGVTLEFIGWVWRVVPKLMRDSNS